MPEISDQKTMTFSEIEFLNKLGINPINFKVNYIGIVDGEVILELQII